MPRKGFTEEQIGLALRQAEAGTAVADISEAWKAHGARPLIRLFHLHPTTNTVDRHCSA